MSRHLVSALCIGCLISLISTVPILPPFTYPDQLKPYLSSVHRHTTATFQPLATAHKALKTANASISKLNATTQRPRVLSATGGKERTAFRAYISTNLTRIVHPNTLKVWPSHADRAKVEPFLNAIIQSSGTKFTTSFRTIHPSVVVKNPPSKFRSIRNQGLMLALRPSTIAQNLSSPSAGRKQQDAKGQKRIRKVPIELTLPMKYLARARTVTDQFVYTDPPVWKDTRYHFQHQSRQPRIHVQSNPLVDYYPNKEMMSTVCGDRSTIIGTDIVTNYIKPHIYQKAYGKRILYNNMRANGTLTMMLMFCHQPKIVPVKTFLECIIMRHMMMESMIPKYPYHQVQQKL